MRSRAISSCGSPQGTSCPSDGFDQALAERNTTGFPPNLYMCDPYDFADDGWSCDGVTDEVLFAYDKTTGKAIAAIEVRAALAALHSDADVIPVGLAYATGSGAQFVNESVPAPAAHGRRRALVGRRVRGRSHRRRQEGPRPPSR